MNIRLILALGAFLLLAPIHFATAETATPIPAVTSEGCDDLSGYIEAREVSLDQAHEDWEELLPGVKFYDDMTDEEQNTFLMTATPDQWRATAKVYDQHVERVSEIDVPPVAEAYHAAYLDRLKLAANLSRDAATLGIVTAAIAYNETGDQIVANLDATGEATLAVCPAFIEVLKLDPRFEEGTPTAS